MDTNKQLRRKLQFAGNSSYVLTLPKAWITSVGLNKTDAEVIIEELPDQTIRVRPADREPHDEINQEIILLYREEMTEGEIIRLILACYLSSKSTITIKAEGDKTLPDNIMLAINEITQKLWGSEIIEDTIDKIVIHDALDPSQLDLRDIIQKSWFTASNMMKRAFSALFTHDSSAVKIISNSEKTLDKLYYLALRQLYYASTHILFAKEIGIEIGEIIDYHLLIKNIERIGDHCEQLVGYVEGELIHIREFEQTSVKTMKACEMAVDSFLKNDENLAQFAFIWKTEIIDDIKKIDLTSNEFPIAKSILRMADYASDIAELTINRKISDM